MEPVPDEMKDNVEAAVDVAPAEPQQTGGVPQNDRELLRRHREHKSAASLLGVLMLGLAIRAWLIATPGTGLRSDIDLFLLWTRSFVDYGFGEFFERVAFFNYPPLSLLIMGAVGWCASPFEGVLSDDNLMASLLKVPATLADIVIALLLYFEGRRLLGNRKAVVASALYFLNPLTFYNSAYWGQVDSIHTALVLLSIVLIGRSRWGLAGGAASLAVLQKFQAIAFAPLVMVAVFRFSKWRGLARSCAGGLAVSLAVMLPFVWHGQAAEAIQRGYIDVVGQYAALSRNAYNVWHLGGKPDASDSTPPIAIVRAAANGQVSVQQSSSWLLLLTARRIALVLFALVVLGILAIYTRRAGPIARYQAAGLLGLAFFLIPTEMHERYAFPSVALLAIWAASGAWRERVFVLLSAMLLLNQTHVLPVHGMSLQIAGMNILLFLVILAGLGSWKEHKGKETYPEETPPDTDPAEIPSRPLVWFRRGAVAAWLVGAMLTGLIVHAVRTARELQADSGVVYLSTLTPRESQQGWRDLSIDRSVGGGVIHLDDEYYIRGLGTHAPSAITYAIPRRCRTFEAVVGIDRETGGKGSVTVGVRLDEDEVYRISLVTGTAKPVTVSIPVGNATTLTLLVNPTNDGKRSDHVDWGAARLICDVDSGPVSTKAIATEP